jgi:hypothetical protein
MDFNEKCLETEIIYILKNFSFSKKKNKCKVSFYYTKIIYLKEPFLFKILINNYFQGLLHEITCFF